MRDETFEAPGRFWRGNLHCHSTLSDGALEPAEVCRRYRDEGYDFISLTDHFVGPFGYPVADTKSFRSNAFTTIPGAEIHSGAMQNGELWHILAVGLPEDFRPSHSPRMVPVEGQETGPELAARARAAGAFVAIAHPEWSGLTEADALSIQAAHAVEVYNHGSEVETDRGRGFHTLDRLLEAGRRLTLVATDDAHFKTADHFGGWVMVKAEENDPDALLAGLKAGRMYSSTGPQIHRVTWEARTVEVACSPAVTVAALGPGSAAAVVDGLSMTRVTLPLGRLAGAPWMRLVVTDAAGRKAWTNPVFPG
ncbi:MAG: CehA/McbA family metallohydrolase [Paracoccaceae bacterium]|jgi:predicted metal-dependent phosphoesterase TrpH|nr:CehA/McbA family metallohydrolase [Paracoccaceae bacterium]